MFLDYLGFPRKLRLSNSIPNSMPFASIGGNQLDANLCDMFLNLYILIHPFAQLINYKYLIEGKLKK